MLHRTHVFFFPPLLAALASLLPCGSCPYYCNVSGNPSSPCARCGKAARAHGDLSSTEEIERRWAVFSAIVAKYDEQNNKEREAGSKMVSELLTPIPTDVPLNDKPPFEDLSLEDVILNLVRETQTRWRETADKDSVRQAGALLNKLISAPGFFKTVVEEHRVRPVSEPAILELWRRHYHQCRLPSSDDPNLRMCEYCISDLEKGLRQATPPPPVTKDFGTKFLRAFWADIRRCAIGIKESQMPPGTKTQLDNMLRDLDQELTLGPSSLIFRKYSQVRIALMLALRQKEGGSGRAAAPAPLLPLAPPPPPPPPPSQKQQSAAPAPPVMPKIVRAPSINDQMSQLAATPPVPKKIKTEDTVGKPDSFVVKVVNDTKSPAGWELLIGLKEVISKQLPEMPKYYIMRALFDGHHESLCVLKNGKVVGGCTFRPFVKQGFVEVVFLVVNPNTTNKGLGSLIMTEVKTFVNTSMKIDYLLTYADNTAIDFFKKQGFSKDITLPRTRWAGYIKDYTKATLMEYHIAPQRDAAIAQQAQWVKNCINATVDTLEVHKGFSDKTHKFPLNPKALGINEEKAISNKIIRSLKVAFVF